MAVSRTLRRLLHLLELEEEQRKTALESAQGELARLARAFDAAGHREQAGRRLIAASAASGELADRLAGVTEARAGQRCATVLKPKMAESELKAAERRREFLEKRVERRQAETLIREREAADQVVSSRRTQQSLDDWYLNGLRNSEALGRPKAARQSDTSSPPRDGSFDRT